MNLHLRGEEEGQTRVTVALGLPGPKESVQGRHQPGRVTGQRSLGPARPSQNKAGTCPAIGGQGRHWPG